MAVAEFLLGELLPSMPFDHHGREVADIIPECVEIAGFSDYYESRFKKTSYTDLASRVQKHALKEEDSEDEDCKIGIVGVSNLVFDREELTKKLF